MIAVILLLSCFVLILIFTYLLSLTLFSLLKQYLDLYIPDTFYSENLWIFVLFYFFCIAWCPKIFHKVLFKRPKRDACLYMGKATPLDPLDPLDPHFFSQ